jgi:hypothetical protein
MNERAERQTSDAVTVNINTQHSLCRSKTLNVKTVTVSPWVGTLYLPDLAVGIKEFSEKYWKHLMQGPEVLGGWQI